MAASAIADVLSSGANINDTEGVAALGSVLETSAINGFDAQHVKVRRAIRAPNSIARQLNAERCPGPGGTPWNPSTIHGNPARGTGILNNELYVGRLV